MTQWKRKSSSERREAASLAAAVMLIMGVSDTSIAADGAAPKAQGHTEQSAWALFGANRYADSADAFEFVISSNPPSARTCYLAARANMMANRRPRAKQLCYYVVNHFGTSSEATLCKKLFDDDAANSIANAKASNQAPPKLLTEATLPADFWANMSTEKRAALKTAAGKMALKKAIDDYNKRLLAHWKGPSPRTAPRPKTTAIAQPPDDTDLDKVATASAAAHAKHKFIIDNTLKVGAHPFTTADIAKDGSNGIDQTVNPNCWFEASMASLADLPRGQRLLASMIKIGGPGMYVVRFPGDGTEYKITEKVMRALHIDDKALWASLIECAQVMKFPNNRGADGETGDQSRLATGLGCITGSPTEILRTSSADAQELSGFIGGAISSKNPIVCGTYSAKHLAGFELIVVPQQAYTIIDFDPASNFLTIRNPHGSHSNRFILPDDPQHRKFEMKENGVFKMHLSLFQRYFSLVCRSFI